jgi:hypothetical protein
MKKAPRTESLAVVANCWCLFVGTLVPALSRDHRERGVWNGPGSSPGQGRACNALAQYCPQGDQGRRMSESRRKMHLRRDWIPAGAGMTAGTNRQGRLCSMDQTASGTPEFGHEKKAPRTGSLAVVANCWCLFVGTLVPALSRDRFTLRVRKGPGSSPGQGRACDAPAHLRPRSGRGRLRRESS